MARLIERERNSLRGDPEKEARAWQANPEARVQMQERTLRLRAQEGEKRRLWRRVVEMYPPYEDYQRRAEGEIPICVP